LQVFSRAYVEGVFKNQFYRQHTSFQSKLKWTRFQTRFESKANEQGECSCVLLATVISSSLESRLHGQIPTFGIEVYEPWSEEDMRKLISTVITKNSAEMYVEELVILQILNQ
jgi:hypothetical protein